jgi:hypothetical protein
MNILKNFGAYFSNNQAAEQANYVQNMCSVNFQGEKNVSKRMMASACIREVCDCAVLGKNNKVLWGKKKAEDNIKRVLQLHEDIENYKKKIRFAAYNTLYAEMVAKLKETFEATRVQAEKEKFAAALHVAHVSSAKESEKGFDIAPLQDGKLQFGKKITEGINLFLLKLQLLKRREAASNEPLSKKAKGLIQQMQINTLKDVIRAGKAERDSKKPTITITSSKCGSRPLMTILIK